MTKRNKDEWRTPKDIFDKLDEEFNFTVDVAADMSNHLCPYYFSDKIPPSAFDIDWAETYYGTAGKQGKECAFWMNPPYSRGNGERFCKKAYEESQRGCIVVGLLKCDTSTKYYHDYVMKAHEIRVLPRRVKFMASDTGETVGSPTFDNIIVIWKSGKPEYLKYVIWDWK